jgi:hypothetical protein
VKTDDEISDPQDDPRRVENIPSVSGVMAQAPESQRRVPEVLALYSLKSRFVDVVIGFPTLLVSLPWNER